MELLAKKIEERFNRVSDAYLYFATYAAEHSGYNKDKGPHHNRLSLNDFIVAAESLRLKMTLQ